MAEKSSFKTGISLPPSLHRRALERARLTADGKFSRYLQHLVAADLDHEPTPSSVEPDILARLARVYGGYFAPAFARQLAEHQVDQPKLLHHLLASLSDCLAAGHDPAQLRLTAPPTPVAPLLAAEAPGPYGRPKAPPP